MAIDKYVSDTRYENAKNVNGEELKTIIKNFSIVAADATDGDIYRVATLPLDSTIVSVVIGCTALTAAVDNNLGLYISDSGLVADADILMDGQTFAALSKVLDGLKTVSVGNTSKTLRGIYEAVNASGTSFDNEKYCDLALTINTKPTANGTVSITINYL